MYYFQICFSRRLKKSKQTLNSSFDSLPKWHERNRLGQISSFYLLTLNLSFISAHITLNHQREIRYRCKNCPLTFLKKKAFVLHHREKHKESIEPWCPLCFEIFDGLKQREDHNCGKIENTGRITICHKHDPPLEFRWVVIVIKIDEITNLRKKYS